MKMITTKDPKVALLNICKKNCVMQHSLASLMQQVVDMKKRCGDDDLFGSARTPESLDRIMEELVYIFSCEANCDIMAAHEVFDGREVEIPVFFDEDSVGKLVSATTVETPSNYVVTIVFSKANP